MNKIQYVHYFIMLVFFRLMAVIPMRIHYFTAEVVTFFLYYVFGYRKKVVFENLRKSFPEKSNKEIHYISRKFFRHLSVVMVETMSLRYLSTKQLTKRLVIKNIEIFEELYKQKKNAIVMVGHLGNWEIGTALAYHLQSTVVGVYKQLSSTVFDKIFFDIRSRFGAHPIEMKEVVRKMLILNKQENPYLLFMVADQAPQKNDTNHWLTFMHQDTNVFLGSEKLAKKFDMPIIYMEVTRPKKGVYYMTPQVLTMKPKETQEFEITETFFKMLEQTIRNNPRYWLWSHRRWKHKRD
ncbi:MAG: lysophospholipid acyltransferase family protein [Salinivirgaceae bacterium]|jgi:KDO2-lipid IV(A) lauroyltransferase|nr:lysophospholipid acyltransferase family protein [Salinivirgaceae bacterium]